MLETKRNVIDDLADEFYDFLETGVVESSNGDPRKLRKEINRYFNSLLFSDKIKSGLREYAMKE